MHFFAASWSALLFSHIKYWTDKNMKAGKNIHNGKAWMYDTLKHFHEFFPFMSKQSLSRALDKLVGHGFILKGNFNKTTYDRTTWYALTDKGQSLCALKTEIKAEKPQNGAFPENGKSIVPNREIEVIKMRHLYQR